MRNLYTAELEAITHRVLKMGTTLEQSINETIRVLSDVDAVGACIGTRGSRVSEIVEELGGEKIDIVEYSDDPKKFIGAALSPATVLSVETAEDGSRSCRVTVPDNQLSLAIGNKGQNARLAAKLTGWKIDIKPESGFYGEEE